MSSRLNKGGQSFATINAKAATLNFVSPKSTHVSLQSCRLPNQICSSFLCFNSWDCEGRSGKSPSFRVDLPDCESGGVATKSQQDESGVLCPNYICPAQNNYISHRSLHLTKI